MKVTIKEAESVKEEIKYPCLMRGQATGSIVLFTSFNCGIMISPQGSTPRGIGEQRTDFMTHNFEKFDGEIILSN